MTIDLRRFFRLSLQYKVLIVIIIYVSLIWLFDVTLWHPGSSGVLVVEMFIDVGPFVWYTY